MNIRVSMEFTSEDILSAMKSIGMPITLSEWSYIKFVCEEANRNRVIHLEPLRNLAMFALARYRVFDDKVIHGQEIYRLEERIKLELVK